MASLTEITGICIRERYRWDSTALLMVETADGDVTVKVDCDPDELMTALEYRFVGQWKTHPKYGDQFHATSFVLVTPHSRQGIIQYLRRAGEGLRFGPVRAAAIYDEWGQEAIAKCRTSPGEVVEMLRGKQLQFDHAAAVNLAARLGEDAALESCMLDVLDLLTGRGFPRGTAREAIREWGARAATVIRSDPYKLMRFRGCGFKRCDALWIELGLPPGRLKRQALAAWYAIWQDTDGHTWYPVTVALRSIQANVGGAEINQEKALRLARLGRRLAEITTDGMTGPVVPRGTARWVAERRNADNEREVAEIVADASTEGVSWPAI